MFISHFRKKLIKGFTLFEILTVVLIIGIMLSIVVAGTSSIKKKARNLSRIADINSIRTALELYKRDNGYYPQTLTMGAPLISPDNAKTYIDHLPTNPSPRTDGGNCPDKDYNYILLGATNYSLSYCITSEISGSGQAASSSGSTLLAAGVYQSTPSGNMRKCQPVCAGRQGLDDGCNGICPCTPNCVGVDGDSDGCGGTCPYYLSPPTIPNSTLFFTAWTRTYIKFNAGRGNGNAALVAVKRIWGGNDITINVTNVITLPQVGDTYLVTTTPPVNPLIFSVQTTNITDGNGTITFDLTGGTSGTALPNVGHFYKATSTGDAIIDYNTLNFDMPTDGVDYVASSTHPEGSPIGSSTPYSYVTLTQLNTSSITAHQVNGLYRNIYVLFSIFEYNQQPGYKSRYLRPTKYYIQRTSA